MERARRVSEKACLLSQCGFSAGKRLRRSVPRRHGMDPGQLHRMLGFGHSDKGSNARCAFLHIQMRFTRDSCMSSSFQFHIICTRGTGAHVEDSPCLHVGRKHAVQTVLIVIGSFTNCSPYHEERHAWCVQSWKRAGSKWPALVHLRDSRPP
jgi:hypothetical protein